MQEHLKPALSLQITHIALSSIWNIAGVILINSNLPALGPTASLVTVSILVVFGALLVLGAARYRPLYLAASCIIGLAALSSIFAAFSKPPSLWPSDFWRYAGAALNTFGVIGAVWGSYIIWRNKPLQHQKSA
jgi:hypothetical protein